MEFTVKRSEWLRGVDGIETPDQSYLRSPFNCKKCCLGFYANACGFNDEQITELGHLEELLDPGYGGPVPGQFKDLVHQSPSGYYNGTDLEREIIRTNDTTSLTDEEREAKLKELFAKAGITINFED